MLETWPFGALAPFCADLILADPPWSFQLRSEKGEAKSPQTHYACQPLDWIKSLPVDRLAGRDCWLLLWATAPLLPEAFDVMRAWGFAYVSRAAWRKLTPNGKPRMGPGYVVRTLHEDLLIGRIGEPASGRALPSLFDGVARQHSRKPDELFPLIERFAPRARKLELFAREPRENWLAWGNETEKFAGEGQGGSQSEMLGQDALRQRRPGPQGAQRHHRPQRPEEGAGGQSLLL